MTTIPTFEPVYKAIDLTKWYEYEGVVKDIVGLIIESTGPQSKLGEWCTIDVQGKTVDAEVVGFRNSRTLLMPLGSLEGIAPGARVFAKQKSYEVLAGNELLSMVLDGLGQPLSNNKLPDSLTPVPTEAKAPNAYTRPLIKQPLSTGIRAIDSLLTIGVGQRMGIFAGSGVGKSTLMGMIAKSSEAEINVICLVGERGRELKEFIENDLGEDGLNRSVVVCATSDQPALVRIKAAFTATAIAEFFRDQGKKVVLMMDSVTRFAMAQREVGLTLGEPPSSKGYTPSVFSLLPRLLERSGNNEKGSITAFYTVLVEGDDTDEPIADTARSILDGHIVLSRKLTSKGYYPPIDILQSLSRTMPLVISEEQLKCTQELREILSTCNEVEDLVSIGAYKHGSSLKVDSALARLPRIESFLKQSKYEFTPFADTVRKLEEVIHAPI